MARIRTIKPEFPQSESMGRVSRDARLLFIQLWTLCDDSGRARAASRMLASLLFPYDDDAPSLISGWLDELEAEQCIRRYEHGGSTYLEVCNWLNHQKIDKPSKSKIPAFDESSRILANPREVSSEDLDQGPRTKDQGREGKNKAPAAARPVVPDWIPPDAWAGYVDMRKRIRKPLTPRAVELAIQKLDQLRADGQPPAEVLDQSTGNGWSGLFPLKQPARGPVAAATFTGKKYEGTPDDELPAFLRPAASH